MSQCANNSSCNVVNPSTNCPTQPNICPAQPNVCPTQPNVCPAQPTTCPNGTAVNTSSPGVVFAQDLPNDDTTTCSVKPNTTSATPAYGMSYGLYSS